GIGAMWALEFVKDPRTKEPDVDLALAVQTAGLKNGLILLTAGFYNNCIRLLPPINIPIPLMDTALDLLADSLDMAVPGKGRQSSDGRSPSERGGVRLPVSRQHQALT